MEVKLVDPNELAEERIAEFLGRQTKKKASISKLVRQQLAMLRAKEHSKYPIIDGFAILDKMTVHKGAIDRLPDRCTNALMLDKLLFDERIQEIFNTRVRLNPDLFLLLLQADYEESEVHIDDITYHSPFILNIDRNEGDIDHRLKSIGYCPIKTRDKLHAVITLKYHKSEVVHKSLMKLSSTTRIIDEKFLNIMDKWNPIFRKLLPLLQYIILVFKEYDNILHDKDVLRSKHTSKEAKELYLKNKVTIRNKLIVLGNHFDINEESKAHYKMHWYTDRITGTQQFKKKFIIK